MMSQTRIYLYKFLQLLKSHRVYLASPILFFYLVRILLQHRIQQSNRRRCYYRLHQALENPGNPPDGPEDGLKPEVLILSNNAQIQSIVSYPAINPVKVELLILIIPGNPGVPYFYAPLMQELAKKLAYQYEIRCLGHTGHVPIITSKQDAEQYIYGLHEQIMHKALFLKERLCENPKLQIILIGHSIGSYISLKLAEEYTKNIAGLVFMQPTIQYLAASYNGVRLRFLFRFYQMGVLLMKGLDFLLPLSIRRAIVPYAVGGNIEPILQLASLSLVDSLVVHNMLYMGAEEMHFVQELQEQLIQLHQDKLLFVYSPVDGWVPSESMQEYQVKFPLAQHRIVPQAHAFMMEENGSRDMAQHIYLWMKYRLGKDQQGIKDTTILNQSHL